MFISETHLVQGLPRAAYVDEAWLGRELKTVLLPAWHPLAVMQDLPRPGDFVTRRLLGHDLILHHTPDGPRAFLNVCAHRLARLTSAACGHAERLKCQYHGWEYAADGRTARIPDAPAFKPLDGQRLGLTPVATASCGQVIFVRLAAEGASLEAFLGPHAAEFAAAFGTDVRPCRTVVRTVAANWKVIVENTLESYHVGEVHRRSLGAIPAEQECIHELLADSSTFTTPGGMPGWAGGLQRWLLASVGRSLRGSYRHGILLPALGWGVLDDIVSLQTFEPLGADRTLVTLRIFAVHARRLAPVRGRVLAALTARHVSFWERVFEEDIRLYPDIQAGLMTPVAPGPGLLSRREERVHHFQTWLAARVGEPAT